jgi:minor histocompatibility antigen H13
MTPNMWPPGSLDRISLWHDRHVNITRSINLTPFFLPLIFFFDSFTVQDTSPQTLLSYSPISVCQLTMELPQPVLDFLGKLAFFLYFDVSETLPMIPTYFFLILAALFPIYTGSHASLCRPPSAAKPKNRKKAKGDFEDDDDGSERVQKIEGMTPMDAITFPVTLGVVLTSLYFLIKWLKDPYMLNKILNWYMAILGVFFLAVFLNDSFKIIRSLVFPSLFSKANVIVKVNPKTQNIILLNPTSILNRLDESDDEATLKENPKPDPTTLSTIYPALAVQVRHIRSILYTKATVKLYIYPLLVLKSQIDAIAVVTPLLSLAVVLYFNLISKPWWITNLLGFSFSYSGLQRMSPTTFWTGTLLLSSLFFYDIYFVFFTPLMVTVATKLDIPVKLLIPRPKVAGEEGPSLAMLGLGDIVIPGMMIALALRFDLYLFYLKKQKVATIESQPETSTTTKSENHQPIKDTYTPASGGWGERLWTSFDPPSPPDLLKGRLFPKPYFYASLIGYLLAMVVTEIVLHTANHAQPALLYLVPGVLGSLWGTAWWRGEFKAMWEYSEEEEEEEDDESKEKKDESEKTVSDKEGQNEKGNILESLKNWLGIEQEYKPATNQPHKNSEEKPPETKPDEESKQDSNPSHVQPILTFRASSKSRLKHKPKSSKSNNKTKNKKSSKALAKASKLLSTDLSNHLIHFSLTLLPNALETPSLCKHGVVSKEDASISDLKSKSSLADSPLASSFTSSSSAAATKETIEQQLREATEGSIRGRHHEATTTPSLSSSSLSSDEEDEDDDAEADGILWGQSSEDDVVGREGASESANASVSARKMDSKDGERKAKRARVE